MGNLGNIGSMFIQLKAEGAEKAQGDIEKTTKALEKQGKVAQDGAKKNEAFMKRWGTSLGAIAVAAGGIYAVMKNSALAGAYMEEFGSILGVVGDSITTSLMPVLDPLMDLLWLLAGAFEQLPSSIQAAVGALAGISVFAGIFDKLFGTELLSTIWAWGSKIVGWLFGSITGAITAGIGLGLAVTWLLDKLGILEALSHAGKAVEEKIPTVFNLVKIITAPLGALGSVVINLVRGNFDKIIPDLIHILWDESLKKVWEFAWDSVTKLFGKKSDDLKTKWMELGKYFLFNPIQATISILTRIISSYFGGGRQHGGPVLGDVPYLVGERGPEIFIPSSSGTVVPNNKLSSALPQTQSIQPPLDINIKVELDGRTLWESVRQYSSAELRRLGGY